MDGISIIIDKDQLELCRNINNHLNKITGLEIEETFYDKMVIKDVNNYQGVYSGSNKVKLKGCFEIYKELHKDQSSTIVPIALKAYFIDNIPIEQTIKNHKDIFDFCIRLKLKKTTDGIFTYVDNGIIKEYKLPRTTRYYISNKGGTILKKHHSTNRVEGVNVGYKTILFNNYIEKENYDINYTYYIKECYKIIDIIENKQLTLF